MDLLNVMELIRLLRAGEGDRRITALLGLNRRTVAKYRRLAEQHGFLAGRPPTLPQVQAAIAATWPTPPPPQQVSTVEPYRAAIVAYRARGMEIAAICTRLREQHPVPISYDAVWRLVRGLAPTPAETFVRVERQPGEEAQVDFGAAGKVIDPATGALRSAWVFVMLLAFSRHLYAELVFDQRLETWLLCHCHAFSAFGGVPGRVVLDNLKAGIVRACLHEPTAQRAYRECAEHYGFLIDPNPPQTPHLKGKVEQGGVHYVKRNFLAGRDPEPLDALNHKLRGWCQDVAGQRVHGTTKQVPWTRFETVERVALRALPPAPYDLAIWKQVKLHRDCHVTFQASYYSAPFRLVGQTLWVRGGTRTVELYSAQHELIATHDRATTPGTWRTHLDHLPPEKVPGLVLTRESCQVQANAIGPATSTLVQRLLDHRPEDRLRSAGRVVRLAQTYPPARVEAACARALDFGEVSYPALKRILGAGLDAAPRVTEVVAASEPAEPRFQFVRHASEFVAAFLGARGEPPWRTSTS
jgi:transposase